FHLSIEESDNFAAICACGTRRVYFHAADKSRLPLGDGSFNWEAIIQTLVECGHNRCLTVDVFPSIDRTSV
ncbi:hypothetical protein ASPBRDRAFT_133921, partial [Aspergillus brasiliensis CBS 101740]